ncbi:MAG TPA: dephospho-CoA kinase [Acidobacteriaceae bacterium]|nr:dephospho-CoA kinase [Acidobacteriaceae bacterium]
MLRVGLTGGLGSGKTTVAAIFQSLGAHVISADALGRELMSPGHDVYDQIVQHFGPSVVLSDGTLNRPLLADLAFRHNRLAELNQIVHPAVVAAQQQWANHLFARDPHAVAIVESALIFEADRQGSAPGWRQRFDRIILVTAPVETRVTRYVDHIMHVVSIGHEQPNPPLPAEIEADSRRRIAAQIPDSEKIPLADYVITNDGPIAAARAQIERIYAELVRLSAQTSPGPTH